MQTTITTIATNKHKNYHIKLMIVSGIYQGRRTRRKEAIRPRRGRRRRRRRRRKRKKMEKLPCIPINPSSPGFSGERESIHHYLAHLTHPTQPKPFPIYSSIFSTSLFFFLPPTPFLGRSTHLNPLPQTSCPFMQTPSSHFHHSLRQPCQQRRGDFSHTVFPPVVLSKHQA